MPKNLEELEKLPPDPTLPCACNIAGLLVAPPGLVTESSNAEYYDTVLANMYTYSDRLVGGTKLKINCMVIGCLVNLELAYDPDDTYTQLTIRKRMMCHQTLDDDTPQY